MTSMSVDEASATGRLHVLDAWVRSGQTLKYTERAILDAEDDYPVLDWWRRHPDLVLPQCTVRRRTVVCMNVDTVSLSCCDLTLRELTALRLPATVRKLVLDHHWLGEGDATELSFSPSLAELFMAAAHVGDGRVFRHFPSALSTLILTNTPLSLAASASLADALPGNLYQLDLSTTHLHGAPLAALLPHLPRDLATLTLASNGLDTADAALLALHLPLAIENLDVSHNPMLGDAGVCLLAAALPATLTDLRLGSVGMRSEGMLALAKHMPPELGVLDVSGACVSQAALEELARRVPRGLNKLDVSQCTREEDDEGARLQLMPLYALLSPRVKVRAGGLA
ncbi:hypothetical protein H9P43_007768 [Blastocladiella emersonii ATCC 22665]|nr:hypothetical protein H9P43_007768 [Blastocladiella emersonii ATCC 22665]